MAIMQGINVVAAAIKASTWGTAVDPDVVLKRIPIERESIADNIAHVPNIAFHSSVVNLADRAGLLAYAGAIEMEFDFTNSELLKGLFFGTVSAPVQQGGTTAYTYTHSINTSVEGLFATLAIEKTVDLMELDSIKVVGYHLTGQAGQPWRESFDIIARGKFWDGSSSYGATADVLTTATYKKDPPPNHVWNTAAKNIIRLNFDSGALDAADKIYPESFELHFTRPMKIFTTNENAPYIDEPIDNGFMEITGSFTLPLYEAIAYEEYMLATTTGKMDLQLVGPDDSIDTGYGWDYLMNLPGLQVTGAPANVDGPETVPQTVSFKVIEVASNPSGMTDTTPYLEVQTNYAASPIA